MQTEIGNKKIETHPFGNFIPGNCRYLLLGSFVAKNAVNSEKDDQYNWYFSTKRNQFWPIMEKIYRQELKTKKQKQNLFKQLGLAFADTILSCTRKYNNSADTSLTEMTFNHKAIKSILRKNNIEKIFFTSRFVEQIYRKYFKKLITKYPNITLVTLPSPSPRYARLNLNQKTKIYKKMMPKIT
jgi:TDG/mug DNA glycosylase family protein